MAQRKKAALPEGSSRDVRGWRLLLQSRHEGVALQRLAALSLGEKCARAEVRPAVHFHIGYGDVIAFLDAADNLMYATVVAPKVGQFFISKEERVRHFVLFHCFGNYRVWIELVLSILQRRSV